MNWLLENFVPILAVAFIVYYCVDTLRNDFRDKYDRR